MTLKSDTKRKNKCDILQNSNHFYALLKELRQEQRNDEFHVSFRVNRKTPCHSAINRLEFTENNKSYKDII